MRHLLGWIGFAALVWWLLDDAFKTGRAVGYMEGVGSALGAMSRARMELGR